MAVQAQTITSRQAQDELFRALELGQSPRADEAVVIAAVLRRLCGFMCPCPPHAIAQMACKSLAPLELPVQDLREAVDAVLEDLTVCGDVIELTRVAMVGAENKPTWLYCAPPSFVIRTGGRIHIFGIASDDAVFLPRELRSQLHRDRAARFIVSPDGAIVPALRQLGLREISESAWMTNVRAETAQQHVDRHQRRLSTHGVAGDMPDLMILQHAQEAHVTYRRRWKLAQDESGIFVGRLAQPYGAPLWYLCQLKDGAAERSLLLPLKDTVDRASDAAWRIQLSMDAARGHPATYDCRQEGEGFTLFFSFPLPVAARRRLLFLGAGRAAEETNPFAFWLPTAELQAERKFLKDYYWIQAKEAA